MVPVKASAHIHDPTESRTRIAANWAEGHESLRVLIKVLSAILTTSFSLDLHSVSGRVRGMTPVESFRQIREDLPTGG